MNKNHAKPEFQTFAEMEKWAETFPDYWVDLLITKAAGSLGQAMDAQGITHAELAERLSVSRPRVTRILGGGQNLTLKSIAEAAFQLGLRWEIELKAIDDSGVRLKSDTPSTSDGDTAPVRLRG